MQIVLLDNCAAHNELMRKNIEAICNQNNIPAEIALESTSYDEVLAYKNTNPPATVYFLDIQLDENRTGIDLCRALRRDGIQDRFIFVSAYAHFSYDCLHLHAYDLLLKPVDLTMLRECLISVYRDMQADLNAMLDIQIGSRIIRVPIKDIYYMEAEGRTVTAHTAQGVYTYNETLARLREKLGPDFLQIHRKYIVNRHYVREFDTAENIITVNGDKLSVSRRMRAQILAEVRK